MAQIGDFQDLLDAIKSAKSILEPSRIDEIKMSYKLERQNQLDVKSLEIVSDEITKLESEKGKLEEAFGELTKEKFKGYLQPQGSLTNYTQSKISTLDDALEKLYGKKSGLQTQVGRLRSLQAQSESAARAMTEKTAEFVSHQSGHMENVFEQAEYEVARDQYKKELVAGDVSEEKINMRMHFFNSAYMAVHQAKYQEQVKDWFDEKTGPNGEVTRQFVAIQQWSSPTTQKVGSQAFATQGTAIPALVETKIDEFLADVELNMQKNYDAGLWTPNNSPIIVGSDGKVSFNDEWMNQKDKYTGQTRREQWAHLVTRGAEAFTAHTNPNQAFIYAMDKGSASRVLLKKESEKVLVPGYSFGKMLWGSSWEYMEDFYKLPSVQKYLSINVRSTLNHKDQFNNFMSK